jgi:hypothetical protein
MCWSCGVGFLLYEQKKERIDKHMLKFVINLLELYLIAWFVFKILKFIVFRRFSKSKKNKGKKRLSILGKVRVLISRQLHSSLDGMLTKQSERFKTRKAKKESLVKTNTQQDSKEKIDKVIDFKSYKSKVVAKVK